MRELQTKMNFGHPIWPSAAILRKYMKVVFWSEMARNANKNEFRASKLAAGGHIGQKMKVAFRSNKMVRNANENEFHTKRKVTFWSEMSRPSIMVWVVSLQAHRFYRKLVRHIYLRYSRARDILYTTVSCFFSGGDHTKNPKNVHPPKYVWIPPLVAHSISYPLLYILNPPMESVIPSHLFVCSYSQAWSSVS